MNLIFILNLESHHQILANENLFHHHSNHFYILFIKYLSIKINIIKKINYKIIFLYFILLI